MAPLQHSWQAKALLICLFLIFITSTIVVVESRRVSQFSGNVRVLLELEDDDQDVPVIKKKPISNKNQTKLIKPLSNSSKNQTKLTKPTISNGEFKNQTKLIKLPMESAKNKTKLIKLPMESAKNKTKLIKLHSEDSIKDFPKSQFKKLNSTSTSNSTSKTTPTTSLLTKKSSDLASPKNKTKPVTTTKTQLEKGKTDEPKSKNVQKKQPSWIDDDDEDDLVSDFRDLPSKFQETFMPDLEKISETSRSYLTKYNKQFTKEFKPYVGNKYAPTIASFVSFAFIIIPLILVSFIFNRIKAYFSLQKLLIFIQIYLAIYFTILCLSSLATGLEPLKFFYSTSRSTYVYVQVLQTLAYVLYLLMLLMYLVLVFSTETGLTTKMLGLGQTFVGFSVGLHYYMTVFHRAVLHQPPKTNWKVHAVYSTCFFAICLLGKADRSKKAYMEEGGEEGKKS